MPFEADTRLFDARNLQVRVDGRSLKTLRVTDDRLYTLAELPGEASNHTLDLSLSPGTEAYAFTFG